MLGESPINTIYGVAFLIAVLRCICVICRKFVIVILNTTPFCIVFATRFIQVPIYLSWVYMRYIIKYNKYFVSKTCLRILYNMACIRILYFGTSASTSSAADPHPNVRWNWQSLCLAWYAIRVTFNRSLISYDVLEP